MQEINKNTEETQGVENEVTEKSIGWYDKVKSTIGNKVGFLYPTWLREKSWKVQLGFFIALVVLIAGVITFLYQKYLIEMIVVAAVLVLGIWFVGSNIGKKVYDWILNSWRDTKLLVILLAITSFQLFYPISNEYLDRAVDVIFISTIGFVYYYLFSDKHIIFNIVKWATLPFTLFLARAPLHHFVVANGMEQFFNIASIIAVVAVIILLLFESFFIKRRERKIAYISLAVLIGFTTIIFSKTITGKISAIERMNLTEFVPTDSKGETFNETPIDESLADIFFSHENVTDEKSEQSDFIWLNGKPALVADTLSGNPWDLWNPFKQSKTHGVRVLALNENFDVLIDDDKNTSAIYSTGKYLGDNTLSAAAKRMGLIEYFFDSYDDVYKKPDKTGISHSIILQNTLKGGINPVKFPKGIRVIKDDVNQTYNFLWGAGDFVALKDAVKKYPFLKGEPIISTEIVRALANSVEFDNVGDKLMGKNLVVPDRDENDNVIIETLYMELKGYKGQFAKVEFVAKKTYANQHKSDKKVMVNRGGYNVVKTWFVPLFYTGGENLKVFVYENAGHGDKHKAKSKLIADFKQDIYSNGYTPFSLTTIVRNGHEFIMASVVKNNGDSYEEAITVFVKSLGKIKQKPVKIESRQELEKFISNFSH